MTICFISVLELGRLRVRPVVVPALQVVRADAARLEVGGEGLLRQLAGVAARAALGEDFLAARDESRIVGHVARSARRDFQVVGLGGGEEEERHVGRLRSFAFQYDEFFSASAILIGLTFGPPTIGMKCSSHSSLNRPMLR